MDRTGRGQLEGWCILQTSGGKTLPLAKSLAAAGFSVWAPVRTIRRPAPGQRRQLVLGLRRRLIEVDVPILPGFVFAWGTELHDLVRVAADPASAHPSFTIFQLGGRVPLVSESSVAGLREAEADATAQAEAMREAEVREAARRHRAEQMRTVRARRKALRSVRKEFQVGEDVVIQDAPALAGLPCTVEESDGGSWVTVGLAGGLMSLKVEAWRVLPAVLDGNPSSTDTAA
jgi:hypothetical protein